MSNRSIRQDPKEASTPDAELIPDTDVPLPSFSEPVDVAFSPQDFGEMVRTPLTNVHLFLVEEPAEPDALAGRAALVLSYYEDTMPIQGFTLVEKSSLVSLERDGYPEGSIGAGQLWEKGNESVLIRVDTWAPYFDPGWKLAVLVLIGDKQMGTSDFGG